MKNSLARRQFLAAATGASVASVCFPGEGLFAATVGSLGGGALSDTEAQSGVRADLLAAESDAYRRAVISGDVTKVEEFLARDAALLYARDVRGQSVYLLAAYAEQPAVMKVLEAKGLVRDVYEASAAGKVDRVHELLRPVPGLVNMPNLAGDTPVHVAALCGRAEVIENAIQYGPDFALRNAKRKNATAAHLGFASAGQAAAESMAFAMAGNGLDPNLADADGNTLLHSAALTGYPRVIRLLLQKGADAAARNAAGLTAVEIAMAHKNADAAELLRSVHSIPRDYYARRFAYASKFSTLQRDDTQGLPRELVNTFAVLSHFGFERVQKLLELVPELLNTRATWDELPVEAAAHMGRADIGGFLLDRGASYSICTAAVFGSLGDVKKMLEEDAKRIRERGAHSFPLLFYTAFGKPQMEIAEYLIAKGADPKEDMRGRTVLHTAAAAGHLDMCRYFLEKGLDPRQKGTNFQGSMDAAEAAELGKHTEVAAMIREWMKTHT